jgi:hypothetical protein
VFQERERGRKRAKEAYDHAVRAEEIRWIHASHNHGGHGSILYEKNKGIKVTRHEIFFFVEIHSSTSCQNRPIEQKQATWNKGKKRKKLSIGITQIHATALQAAIL